MSHKTCNPVTPPSREQAAHGTPRVGSPSSYRGSRLFFPQPRGRTLGLERLPSWPSSCPLNVRPDIPDTVQLEHTLGISSYTRRDSHPEAPSGDVVAPLQSACRTLELIPSSDQRSKRIDHTSA